MADPYDTIGNEESKARGAAAKEKSKNNNDWAPPSLAEQELRATENDGNRSAASQSEKDNLYYGGRPKKKKQKSGRSLTRRQKIGVGIGSGFIGGSILFAFFPVLAPLKILQFGSLLRQTHFFSFEEFGEDRSSKLTTFYRRIYGETAQSSRLGIISSKYAGRQEARFAQKSGLRPVYDKTFGIFQGFHIEDPDKASSILKNLDQVDGVEISDITDNPDINLGRQGATIDGGDIIRLRGPPGGSGTYNDLVKLDKFKRTVIKDINKSLDLSKVTSFVSSRMLIKMGGVDFTPWKNLKRIPGESLIDFYKRRSAAHRERIKTGAEAPIGTDLDRQVALDENGDPIPDGDTDGILNEAKEDLASIRDVDADLPEIKKGLVSKAFKVGGAAAAVVSVLCAARDLVEASDDLQFQNTVLIPMRMGFEGISIAAQLLTLQNVSLDEVRYFYELLYDEASGLDYTAAAPVQAAMGAPVNGVDINDGILPGTGRVPEFFLRLSGNFLLDAVCFVDSTVGKIISRVTFGLSDKISELAQDGIDVALESTTGMTIEEIIDSAVGWLAGEAVDTLAEGPFRSNPMMYGALYAANAQALGSGGAVTNNAEAVELQRQQTLAIQEDMKTASVFDRYLNPTIPQSLASYAIFEAPTHQTQAVNGLASLFNPVEVVRSSVASIAAPKAYAASSYQYKVPKVSFSVAEQENPLVEDPYLNAEYVEANFTTLNARFSKCFPTKLSLPEGSDDIGVEVQSFTDNPVTQFSQDEDCLKDNMDAATQNDYLRFRMFMNDTVDAKAINCYEGDTASCEELSFSGFTGSSSGSSGTTLNAEGLNGFAIPCQGQPTPVKRDTTGGTDRADWTGLTTSGSIGTGTNNKPINVYIREACPGVQNPRTVLIVSSIHGSENGGQLVGHELLFNADLPDDVRIVVVPEVNGFGIDYRVQNGFGGRVNGNGVNLNRNNDYRWSTMDGVAENITPSSTNYRGVAPNSEPETQALQKFISSLGDLFVSIHYHDNINYVASAGNSLGIGFAEVYARTAGVPFGNDGDSTIDVDGDPQVNQRGSLDGWQGSTFANQKVLLVEMDADQSPAVIQRNVEAVKAIVSAP